MWVQELFFAPNGTERNHPIVPTSQHEFHGVSVWCPRLYPVHWGFQPYKYIPKCPVNPGERFWHLQVLKVCKPLSITNTYRTEAKQEKHFRDLKHSVPALAFDDDKAFFFRFSNSFKNKNKYPMYCNKPYQILFCFTSEPCHPVNPVYSGIGWERKNLERNLTP